jgi:molybdopterin-guanine dinucleotide biosynthesis protein MobB
MNGIGVAMQRVHIVGRKKSGKTTLVVELVKYLSEQGYRVGTIKHTHHHHELDTPGKDSHQHREAGSAVVGILSPGMTAVFQPRDDKTSGDGSRYAAIAPMFAHCDLVLVEGNLRTQAPRVEVWRAALSKPPIAATDSGIVAIVSDDTTDVGIPQWKRSEINAIARGIMSLVGNGNSF